MQDEITTNLSAALAPEIYRAEASAPRASPSTDLTAWDRFLRGLSHYYRQTKAGFRSLDRPVQGGHRARSGACDRARLSRHHPGAGRAVWMDQEHARIVDARRWSSRKAASGSIPARPSRFRSCPTCMRSRAITRRRMEAAQAGGRTQSRTTWAPAACSASVISSSASTGEAIELFSIGRAARHQRSPISMGGLERVQPLSARAI